MGPIIRAPWPPPPTAASLPGMARTFLLLACAALWACTSITVDTQFDRGTDFKVFKTWNWLDQKQPPTGDLRVDDVALQNRIRTAIERSLASRGYERVFEGQPDFRVAYFVSTRTKTDAGVLNRRVGYPVGENWGPGGEMSERQVYQEYDKGTLILDVVDAREEKLVFRGVAERKISSQPAQPAQSRKLIAEVVEAILEDFPP